jgi:uncharacterized protein DUF4430
MALLGAALAIAACGIGPGASVGPVSLTVTRDYGRAAVAPRATEEASESDTVMRVLDRNAKVSTRYGGGYVRSIEGVSEAVEGGDRFDWFFYVNGVESPIGAADSPLHGGEAIWWDYRDWSAAERVPAVVGSWPRPFAGGYEGEAHPVAVECDRGGPACAVVRRRLTEAGAALAARAKGDAIRVLVGPWARLRADPAAAQLERGPQFSGVFARFSARRGGYVLQGLDEGGETRGAFGPRAGLLAATRRYEAPPVWLVTGASAAGVEAAAALLDTAHLRDRYALVAEGGTGIPVPLPGR